MIDTNLLLLPKADAGLGEQGRSLGAGQDHLLPVGASHVHLGTAASNAVFGFRCRSSSILIVVMASFSPRNHGR